ncbi:MAG: acyltransferase [Solirubrobacteraceae bacterium]|nr:acyltransferase [Solirubrobacteraceae bacterium]
MQAPVVKFAREARHTKDDGRLASLDGIRGLGALAVFAFHGWLYTMPAPSSTNRSSIGDYAVHELRLALVSFFVLSGFLLARPWFAAALEHGRPPNLRRYARARAARVLPAYYVALAGSIALLWGLQGTPGLRLPPSGELPLFLVFGQNFSATSVLKLNPPMWSLAVEAMFYALLPLIGWLALRLPQRRRTQALVPLALLALGLLYNWTIAGRGLGLTFSKTLAAMLPYFALGMLTALLMHGRTIDMRTKRNLMALGVALVALDALMKAAAPALGLNATILFSTIRDLPSGVGFALIIAALVVAPRSRFLGGRALAAMGVISYGFYLWHVPVLLVMRGNGWLPLDPVLGSLAAFGPSLALAVLSWFAIERPALRWAARRNRQERRAARAADEARLGRSGTRGREVSGRDVGTVRT